MCMTCDATAGQFDALTHRPERGDRLAELLEAVAALAADYGLPHADREIRSLARGIAAEAAQAREAVRCEACGRAYHPSWPNHVERKGRGLCDGHRREAS